MISSSLIPRQTPENEAISLHNTMYIHESVLLPVCLWLTMYIRSLVRMMLIERMKSEDPNLRMKEQSYSIHHVQSLSYADITLDYRNAFCC